MSHAWMQVAGTSAALQIHAFKTKKGKTNAHVAALPSLRVHTCRPGYNELSFEFFFPFCLTHTHTSTPFIWNIAVGVGQLLTFFTSTAVAKPRGSRGRRSRAADVKWVCLSLSFGPPTVDTYNLWILFFSESQAPLVMNTIDFMPRYFDRIPFKCREFF